jgi:hypothetical protein
MADEKKQVTPLQALLTICMVGGGIWYFYGGGLEKQAANDMRRIENEVAAGAVREYNIAKEKGDPMDACVHAGLVAAAYLQAKDSSNYEIWKATERADCDKAGLPK